MDPIVALMIAFNVQTAQQDLPQGLLPALCYVESHFDVKALHKNDGKGSSIGPCQVKKSTARMLGFTGSEKALAIPGVNAHYAALYLRYQLDRYDGDVIKAVAAYNAGTYFEKKGRPVNLRYVRKVINEWEGTWK